MLGAAGGLKGGQEELKHLKARRLCLANGDEYDKAELRLEDDVYKRFVPVQADGKNILVNPDYIISLEEDLTPSVISSS